MTLKRQNVLHVAHLARLEMDDENADKFVPQLNGILNWVEQLSAVNTDQIAPMSNVTDIDLKMRPDTVQDGTIQDDVLANAPETTEGYFVVQKIIE